jgi:hypothetical protein
MFPSSNTVLPRLAISASTPSSTLDELRLIPISNHPRDFVDFALPRCLHCPRLVFASRMIRKWNDCQAIPGKPTAFARAITVIFDLFDVSTRDVILRASNSAGRGKNAGG